MRRTAISGGSPNSVGTSAAHPPLPCSRIIAVTACSTARLFGHSDGCRLETNSASAATSLTMLIILIGLPDVRLIDPCWSYSRRCGACPVAATPEAVVLSVARHADLVADRGSLRKVPAHIAFTLTR